MRLRNSTSPKEKETTLQQEFREALLAGDKEFTWELSLNLMDGTSFGIIILILVIWLVVRGFFHRDRFVFLRLIPPIFLIFQVSLIFMVNASSLTDKSIIPVLTNEGYSVSTLYHLNEDNPSILVVTDLEDSEVIHRVEISYGIDGEPNSVKIPTALSEEFKLKASTK